MLTFLKQPTKLFFEDLPGNLNGSLLPPIKTLLEVSIEKDPDVIHVSLYALDSPLLTVMYTYNIKNDINSKLKESFTWLHQLEIYVTNVIGDATQNYFCFVLLKTMSFFSNWKKYKNIFPLTKIMYTSYWQDIVYICCGLNGNPLFLLSVIRYAKSFIPF